MASLSVTVTHGPNSAAISQYLPMCIGLSDSVVVIAEGESLTLVVNMNSGA